MANKILESAQQARHVRRLPSVETQVRKLVSEGNTVYVSTAVHKVKHGRETLEFEPLYDMDESDMRPQVVGGIFATRDEEVIARIDSLNPRIHLDRIAPEAPVAVDTFADAVLRRGPSADSQVEAPDSDAPVSSEADKAALLASAGRKGR